MISAPRERVFEAWTTTRSFEFREGGVWDFTMHGPDGTDYPNWIQWREIVPPDGIRFVQGSRPDDPDAFESTVSFRAVAAGTELTLRSEFKTKAQQGEPGKDLFVFGSAKLCDSLMRQGLIDEYRVCIAPVVLREGTPLWKPGGQMRGLQLLESRALQTGGVLLRYAPKS